MIRFFAVLAVLMLSYAGPLGAADDIFLGSKSKKSDQGTSIYNSKKNNNSTVYKGPAAPKEKLDHMEQLMEENRQADYEIIKNESLKTKDKIMKNRAERAAKKAAKQKEKDALSAKAAAAADPAAAKAIAAEQEKKEAGKKVYVKKSSVGTAPKKVFNSYD